MTEEDKATRIVHGQVKWFDPAKGFGFIVSDASESDILLHANVLRNYGQNSVADGASITVRVQQSPRGVQAVEVVAVQAPAGGVIPLVDEGTEMTAEDIAALALEPARVKWFDKAKGFGFANVFGRHDDVFIHIEVLRMSGFADLQAGEAICLRIIEGKRGRMAVQVASWEAASRSEA
ncbi:MAG: cold shock domain-containing protein [Cypionkella sp.]|jgi:CspA family cold shock protein|nr:cold shock domain-containing protein [Cypionkella sp.]